MIPTRPYLIRAIHQWACDNGLTPHLVVDATVDGVVVPGRFVTDGVITLNISPSAVQGLELGDDWILFNARFSGAAMNIEVPVMAVQAIYARENSQGIFFPPEDEAPGPDDDGSGPGEAAEKPSRPALKVIK